MTTLTWLSTDDYREGETPLDSIMWCGILFTAGDKVEVNDPWMIAKARGNRFFRVEDSNGGPRPETWTNDPPPPPPIEEPSPAREDGRERPDVRYPTTPPDYPPEDEPEREPNKKRRGRPPRIRDNGNGDQ